MSSRGRQWALTQVCLQRNNAAVRYLYTVSFPATSHAVNLLSALPLQCLDVLLMVPPEPDSQQCRGVNMDCVHTLLMFMERRLESVNGLLLSSSA